MKKRFLLIIVAALAALWLAGCTNEEPAPVATDAPSAVSMGSGNPPPVGIVAEVLEGDGYTYVLLRSGDNIYWLAAPQAAINLGEQVAISDPVERLAYKSEELGRDFEKIFFVSSLISKASMQPAGSPHAGDAKKATGGVDLSNVAKFEGGVTVGELFEKSESLVGNEIALRGKVVKFTGGVMGTNWVHIRDGSGAQGTNDITVTSNDMAAVGDTVVVRGMLEKDVDIGSGYFFPLVIQGAKLTVE